LLLGAELIIEPNFLTAERFGQVFFENAMAFPRRRSRGYIGGFSCFSACAFHKKTISSRTFHADFDQPEQFPLFKKINNQIKNYPMSPATGGNEIRSHNSYEYHR